MSNWKTCSGRAIVAAIAVAGISANASASSVIDFNSLSHGEIVNNQIPGVRISVENEGGGPDLGVAFDSEMRQTRDPDLEGPSAMLRDTTTWAVGNMDENEDLGRMLIIQENNAGTNDGIANHPDDEGSRPAGNITFDFDHAINSFGFDLVDVDGPRELDNGGGFFATFGLGQNTLKSVSFDAFTKSTSPFYSNATFGNHSANRIDPITAEQLGIHAFDQVTISLGGSGAVDNVTTTAVPSPTAATAGLVIGGLMLLRRKRRRQSPPTEA